MKKIPAPLKKITPMLATLVEKPFDREGWLFEIKWDGYRALAFKDQSVSLLSRNHISFNSRFPGIVKELKRIAGSFILDGEIVVLDENGRSDFQQLQNLEKMPYYYIFDILFLNGEDLRGLPLLERKAILYKLLKEHALSQVRFGDHIEKRGVAFFKAAKKKKLEGIIAKRADSSYSSRRSRDWLKMKSYLRQEVVIGGFTAPRNSREYFGALLVGVYKRGKLVYAGHVGGGFDQELLSDMHRQLQKIIVSKCPFAQTPKTNMPATWVKPKLVCEVSFAEWTDEGIMRQPIFKGLRIDKTAKEVVREQP